MKTGCNTIQKVINLIHISIWKTSCNQTWDEDKRKAISGQTNNSLDYINKITCIKASSAPPWDIVLKSF
jgi:hypothetical protein